jgi:hypothetical protein
MLIAIHQPDYIPYIGYFYKMAASDIFAFLDDAQFSNDNMHHWNRIKTPNGEQRLKIPLDYHFGDAINKVRTKDELKWKEKHLKIMELNYAKAKYFKDIYPVYREILLDSYTNLADMNIAINLYISKEFGIMKKYIRTSELNIQTVKEEKVIDICKALNGTEYISGLGARVYQKEENFIRKGIKLSYTDYQAFVYPQLWKGFLPNLSMVDYIFNCGFEWNTIDKSIKSKKGGLL